MGKIDPANPEGAKKGILALLPHHVISDECHPEQGPLMTRYFLTPRWGPLAVYLHCFHRSDNDRHFHDHPWSFITLILKGGYLEHQEDGTFRRRVGTMLFRKATHRHWVELAKGKKSWSLVIRFRRIRMWGFWTEEGFVVHNEYDCRGGK